MRKISGKLQYSVTISVKIHARVNRGSGQSNEKVKQSCQNTIKHSET